jgi:hypothetical protein
MQKLSYPHPGNTNGPVRFAWLAAALIALVVFPYLRDFLVYLVMKIYSVIVQHRSP